MLTFYVCYRDAKGISISITKCHDTVKNICAVMGIDGRSYHTKISYFTCRLTILGYKNINKTTFVSIFCWKKIISMCIFRAYCFIETSRIVVSPFNTIFHCLPSASCPFEPLMPLFIIISWQIILQFWLKWVRVAGRLLAYFYCCLFCRKNYIVGSRVVSWFDKIIIPKPFIITSIFFLAEIFEIVLCGVNFYIMCLIYIFCSVVNDIWPVGNRMNRVSCKNDMCPITVRNSYLQNVTAIIHSYRFHTPFRQKRTLIVKISKFSCCRVTAVPVPIIRSNFDKNYFIVSKHTCKRIGGKCQYQDSQYIYSIFQNCIFFHNH